MSPGELYDAVQGYRMAQEADQNRAISQAWLIAALMRQKRLPDLARLLERPEHYADGRTPDECRAEYTILKRRLGLDR